MNSPTIKGKIKTKINPSNLSWNENEVNPNINSSQSNSSCSPAIPPMFAPVVETKIPARIKAVLEDATMTLLVFEIFDLKMKNKDIGKKVAVNAFEKIDAR